MDDLRRLQPFSGYVLICSIYQELGLRDTKPLIFKRKIEEEKPVDHLSAGIGTFSSTFHF